MSGYGIILQLGFVQYSEHNERFVERLLRLLYWTTVHSERSLNGSKPQIGVFAVANKDAGAHRVFFIITDNAKVLYIAQTMGDNGGI